MIKEPPSRSFLHGVNILITQTLGVRFLLSLVAAIGLWIYLTEQNAPGTKEVTIPSPVPVEIKGAPSDLIVVPQPGQLGPPSVQVAADVDSSLVNKVTSSWFQATIDVSGETQPGTKQYPVQVVSLQQGVDVKSRTPPSLPVTLDREAQRDLPISQSLQGNLPTGYTLGQVTYDTQTVTVRGPESVLQKVAAVIAVIRLDNRKANFQDTVKLLAQNAQGGDVTDPNLQLSPQTVRVNVVVQQEQTTRTVAVLPQISGQPAEGYVVAGVSLNPAEVILVGNPSSIESVVSINTEPIDVSGAIATVTKNATLLAPKDTSIAGGPRVQVTAQVQPVLSSVLLAVAPRVVGASAGTQVQVGTGSINVSLQGTAPVLKALQPRDVSVVLDVSGLGTGSHDIVPLVTTPQGVSSLGVSPEKVRVTLIPPTPTPTTLPTATPVPTAMPTPAASSTPAPTAAATRTSVHSSGTPEAKPVA